MLVRPPLQGTAKYLTCFLPLAPAQGRGKGLHGSLEGLDFPAPAAATSPAPPFLALPEAEAVRGEGFLATSIDCRAPLAKDQARGAVAVGEPLTSTMEAEAAAASATNGTKCMGRFTRGVAQAHFARTAKSAQLLLGFVSSRVEMLRAGVAAVQTLALTAAPMAPASELLTVLASASRTCHVATTSTATLVHLVVMVPASPVKGESAMFYSSAMRPGLLPVTTRSFKDSQTAHIAQSLGVYTFSPGVSASGLPGRIEGCRQVEILLRRHAATTQAKRVQEDVLL